MTPESSVSFAMAEQPNVFSIPASAPFLPTLIDALLDGRLIAGFPADQRALADATIAVGANDIAFLVGWSGPTYGTVSRTGIVSVNDRPADGLTLDGTPVPEPAS